MLFEHTEEGFRKLPEICKRTGKKYLENQANEENIIIAYYMPR